MAVEKKECESEVYFRAKFCEKWTNLASHLGYIMAEFQRFRCTIGRTAVVETAPVFGDSGAGLGRR